MSEKSTASPLNAGKAKVLARHLCDYKEIPPFSPVCKYPGWLVETSSRSTTNPMTQKAAMKMVQDRLAEGKYAKLIKVWSCVSIKNLQRGTK